MVIKWEACGNESVGIFTGGEVQALETQLVSFFFILESIETTSLKLHENSTTERRAISKNHSTNVWKEQKEGQ
mgnify:FL=1